jgi:hypothetical protein
MATLKDIGSKFDNPFHQRPLLIISGFCDCLAIPVLTKYLQVPNHGFLQCTALTIEGRLEHGWHYCLMERALSGYMSAADVSPSDPNSRTLCRESCMTLEEMQRREDRVRDTEWESYVSEEDCTLRHSLTTSMVTDGV